MKAIPNLGFELLFWLLKLYFFANILQPRYFNLAATVQLINLMSRGCAHKIGQFFFGLNDFFMHERC